VATTSRWLRRHKSAPQQAAKQRDVANLGDRDKKKSKG
jgi:hypothetical protein